MMEQTMRWFGPNDPVSLSDIRQAGCSGAVTALHHIPVGNVWTVDEINQRKRKIEAAGLSWTVIESLPVHEDIKRHSGDFKLYIENYQASLRNVAACGLKVVTYNFMPVFDWLRTDISYKMPDGSLALYFERMAFIVFDIFLLERPGAERDYTAAEIAAATQKYVAMTVTEKEKLFSNILLGLPGSDIPFTVKEVLEALKTYQGTGRAELKKHLIYFLEQVVPVAEECGLQLAIHPDDPPYGIMGLPRVVSTEQDIADLLNAVPSPANGLCFCTGSLGARADNDILKMLERFAGNIHFLHLRNTKRDEAGNFFEAGHLAGDTDMYEVVKKIVQIMQNRKVSIPMRPDHGHQMLDDLDKKTYPGYSAIGRLRGLAELRGLELGICKMLQL